MVENGVSFSVESIAHALVNIYKGKMDIDHEIEGNLFQESRRIFQEAIAEGYANAVEEDVPLPEDDFREAILHSSDVFSAFRTHKMQNDIAAQLLNSEGQLKPFNQFVKDVSPYIEHRNRAWLQTEYNTAVIRAQNAAEWKMFEHEREVYPNLEWVESISAHPGEDHRIFWGTIRPVDDPFWSEHRPGDRWNCKCELRQTDKDTTSTPVSDGKSDPARGLENNPGKSKELFSQTHPYYPQNCMSCPFAGNKLAALFMDLRSKKNCHACTNIKKHITTKKEKSEAKRISRRQAKKSVENRAFSKVKNFKPCTTNSKAVKTGVFYDNKEGFRRLLAHCYDETTLKTALSIRKKINKLKFVRVSKLGEGKDMSNPKDRKNIQRKRRRGVLCYHAYTWTNRKGIVFDVKMEVYKGYECLYWLRKRGKKKI